MITKSRKIISLNGGSASLNSRVTTLENNEYKVTYFQEINSASGSITIPTGATILLDQFQGGADAYVSTISNTQPTGIFPETSGGNAVDVTSFDTLGAYVLTGTPSSFPVALIFILKIKAVNYSNLTITNILDQEGVNDLVKNSSAVAGNYTGTSVPKANALQMLSGQTGNNPQVTIATPIVNLIGATSTNLGTRLDANGLTVGALSILHTANTGRAISIKQDTSTISLGSWTANTGYGAIYVNQSTPGNANYSFIGDGSNLFFNLNTPTTARFGVLAGGGGEFFTLYPNRFEFKPNSSSSSSVTNFTFTTPASTAQTLSTETIGADFDFTTNTIQHATGALTTNRDFVIRARTHSFVGASTLTDAATLAITNAPQAGTNATITNAYALWVQTGKSRIGGDLVIDSGKNVTLNATTGTKIGTATTEKLSFWNATPIVQPTTAIAAATFVANTSGTVNDSATFDGYTIGQVVKALRNTGILA